MILAVDIGGTKTRVALFERVEGRLARRAEKSFPSQEHAGLESIVRLFQEEHPGRPLCASFGVAGPVRDGRSETTNLPWLVDSRRLADLLGLERVGFGVIPVEIKINSLVKRQSLRGLENFIADTNAGLAILINRSKRIELLTDKIVQIPVNYI